MNETDKQMTLINYLNNPRTSSMSHNFTLLPKECRIRSLDLCKEHQWQLTMIINTLPHITDTHFIRNTCYYRQVCWSQAYRKLNLLYGHLGNTDSGLTVRMLDSRTSSRSSNSCQDNRVRNFSQVSIEYNFIQR